MKNKKVVVTGGAGFIGSHLVELLIKKKFNVIVIDNFSTGRKSNLKDFIKTKKLTILNKDIVYIKKNDPIFKNCLYVFHLAGKGDIVPSIQDPSIYMKTNIQGTINILECCRFHKIKKIIYAASSSCYGLAKTPTTEKDKIDTRYPYALSKYFGEQCILHWSKVYGIPFISIRIFNAYGTRVKTTGVYGALFGVLLKQKLSKKTLTIVGNGMQKRDFCYVTDVVDAFYRAATFKVKNKIFNLGSGNPIKIIDIAKLIGGKIIFLPKRPGEPDITHANISKIKKYLKWKPKISISEGLKKMLDNINDWQDAPLWTKNKIQVATKDWFKYLSE